MRSRHEKRKISIYSETEELCFCQWWFPEKK